MANKPIPKKGKDEIPKSYIRTELTIVIAIICILAGFFIGKFSGGGAVQSKAIPLQPQAQGQGDSTDWISDLEQQTKQNPGSAVAWTNLGNAYFDSDRYPEAIKAYEKSLGIAPGNPNILTDLGIMYRRVDQPNKAIELFDQAMNADPTHEMSIFNKGIVLYYDLKNIEGAKETWMKLVELNPRFSTPNGQLLSEFITTLQ
jgi:cytochrome c-type biogenesis protein CcmH/NrfG